jgi:hypothetical protein
MKVSLGAIDRTDDPAVEGEYVTKSADGAMLGVVDGGEDSEIEGAYVAILGDGGLVYVLGNYSRTIEACIDVNNFVRYI